MNTRSTPSGPASAAAAGTLKALTGRFEAPTAIDSRHDPLPLAALAAKEAP